MHEAVKAFLSATGLKDVFAQRAPDIVMMLSYDCSNLLCTILSTLHALDSSGQINRGNSPHQNTCNRAFLAQSSQLASQDTRQLI